jgi:hypothetical protein
MLPRLTSWTQTGSSWASFLFRIRALGRLLPG